ncbi:uncharacterized protein LOC127532731 [Acanthochromis polyacanthus]|uniref:uncharacterized protein LOC127532731 n=1 Tax=Acanthochromis polyacanthus TaxID=80966 RepID=UPI0022345CA7|nr:uncharacterized protein LOC127532731 [Acanthochromis polyacanthus]
MLPISTVESPSFRSILRKIQTADGQESTSDRKTFASYLEKCYSKMESELKSTFERLEYVSTTADIWTCHNKSFLGMTAHWINPNNFKREKAAIACRRIKGRHTYDVVASEIEHVHSAFGLTHKVTATVTDNGSNFVKAFRVYEAATAPSDSEEEGGEEEEDNVVFADADDILSNGTSDGEYTLPPHLRCASHTLNLISNNDVNKWLSANAEAKSVFRSATAKCSALWTKCSRSTVASELVENICKRKLIIPVTTRWNSFHDALTCILTIPVPQLNHLCAQLDIRVLSEREHKFLSEYCSVMKPLSIALDILQGEDNCYYGCLLPTLEVLMSKVLALQPSLSRMTAGLPDVIVQSIKTRFASVLENKDAQLAAVTLPKFKLRWLKEEHKKDSLKTLLITECRTSMDTQQEVLPFVSKPQASSSNKSEIDFFAFEDDHPTSRSCESEIFGYFQSGCEVDILHQFPNIKTLFLKLNTRNCDVGNWELLAVKQALEC